MFVLLFVYKKYASSFLQMVRPQDALHPNGFDPLTMGPVNTLEKLRKETGQPLATAEESVDRHLCFSPILKIHLAWTSVGFSVLVKVFNVTVNGCLTVYFSGVQIRKSVVRIVGQALRFPCERVFKPMSSTYFVDLGRSFKMRLSLQNSASMEPRKSHLKFSKLHNCDYLGN